jgi:hypothetical protein
MSASRTPLDSLRLALIGRVATWCALVALVSTLAAPFAVAQQAESQSALDQVCVSVGLDGPECHALLLASDADAALAALDLDEAQRADLSIVLNRTQGFSAPPLPLAAFDSARSSLRGVSSPAPSALGIVRVAPDAPTRPSFGVADVVGSDERVLSRPAASGVSPRAP